MKKVLFLLITSIVILSACGNKEETSTNTKVYESKVGSVSIPKDPKKIVTDGYCGDLLAIEANVVGCDLTYKSPVWDTSSITDIGQSTEKVASLNPDLIITFNEDNYNLYKNIAPTIYIPYGTYNEEDLVLELAKIVNKEKEADKLLKEFNNEVDDLKKVLSKKIDLSTATFTTMESWGEDTYVYGNTWARFGYIMYDKLNLNPTEEAKKNLIKDSPDQESYLVLTQELVNQYVGDYVLLVSPDGKKDNNPLINSDVFKNTKAYKNNNVYYVDSNLFYNNDILSLFEQIKVVKGIVENE